MSLIPRQADLAPGVFRDEVDNGSSSVASDTTTPKRPTPVAAPESEDRRRRRWWHLGPYIDRVRGDSLFRNGLFILANTLVTTAVGYLFWLVAAHLYSASVVGLTVAITSASGIV